MRTRTFALALLFAGLLVTPAQVRAADPSSSGTEATVMTDKARQLYEDGLAAIQKSKWLEARAALLAAWSLNKHWQIAANLAGCEIELGKYRDAAEHAAYYLRNAPADRRAKAELVMNRAKAKVGALTMSVDVDGADVLVDEVSVGRSPLKEPIYLDPGEHRVLVRLHGRPDVVQKVALAAGESKGVAIKMEAEVGPVAAGTGAPSVEIPPPPPPVEGGGANRAVLVSGGVGAGVALGMGVVFAVLSSGKANAVKQQRDALVASAGTSACTGGNVPADCAGLQETIQTHNTFSRLEGWSFIGAGALGAGTVIYWLAAPKAVQKSGVAATPIVTSCGGGISVIGVW
jgi:hypothetical protein